MKRILIIQTAFIGDVILATPIIEKLKLFYPNAEIDFLLRKGNEELLEHNPHISKLIIWNKKESKYLGLFKIIASLRRNRYDLIVNPQRFFTTGFVTWLLKSKFKSGFDKNPFSFCFTHKIKHEFKKDVHEVDRNISLIQDFTDLLRQKPKLYFSEEQKKKAQQFVVDNYICISPASVWFTKQLPVKKWIEFINIVPQHYHIYLLGSKGDSLLCDEIISGTSNSARITNLAGKLSLLESTLIMQNAKMNYVNDSAPLHLASAVDASVKAIFCSTTPDFGFGPLSAKSEIIEANPAPECKPCGIHGFKNCPKQHFKCAEDINVKNMLP